MPFDFRRLAIFARDRFRAARCRLIGRIQRDLVHWQPLQQPQQGYSIIIGTKSTLESVLLANLIFLQRQRLKNLYQTIVVFDRPADDTMRQFQQELVDRFAALNITCVNYSSRQATIARFINSGWTYSWMSWTTGMAQARTEYVLLHDLDALLLDPDFVEKRYNLCLSNRANYLGIQPYISYGFRQQDNLVGTMEMFCNAAMIRSRFRPIQIYDRWTRYQGRFTYCDTFIWSQMQSDGRHIYPINYTELVHPNQMICQYNRFVRAGAYVPPARNNLLLIPYFMYVAGEPRSILELIEAFNAGSGRMIPFLGRLMDMRNLTWDHADVLERTASFAEIALVGQMRPQVSAFFHAMKHYCEKRGSHRQAAA